MLPTPAPPIGPANISHSSTQQQKVTQVWHLLVLYTRGPQSPGSQTGTGLWPVLNHSPTPTPVCGKIVFHETSPWCQKVWGPLLYTLAKDDPDPVSPNSLLSSKRWSRKVPFMSTGNTTE